MAYEPITQFVKNFVPEERFTNDTAATTNENIAISGSGTSMWIANESNTAAELIYFKFGTSAQNAATGNVFVVYPGTFGTVPIAANANNMAFISAAGTPNFKFMRGNGNA